MGDQEGVASIRYQPSKPINDSDPAFRGSQQQDTAVRTNASAIKGGRDFLAGNAWQIEWKIGIRVHGGCGRARGSEWVWCGNRNLFQNNALRYTRCIFLPPP